jgi:hypothetical protein
MVDLEWDQRTVIILVSGKAGVGKTTFADFVMKNLPPDVKKYSAKGAFATVVKQVAKMMGWNGQKDDNGRKLLQNVGNVGREYNSDTWVGTLINFLMEVNIIPLDLIIIDDWRFPNELNWFLNKPNEYKVYTVRISAPSREMLRGTPYYNDVSETSLPDESSNYNYYIDNEGSLEALEQAAKDVLENVFMFV